MRLATLLVLVLLLAACGAPVQRHQKGGSSSQSLGAPMPPAAPPPAVPSQSMQQPENPEGRSLQEMTRTTTVTSPDGTVTTTIERARTEIGGSQDLTAILKAYASGEYMRRLALALVFALVAWLAHRRGWPTIGATLGLGALVIAFFGPGYALAFAGAGVGVYVAYFVVRAQLGLPAS